MNESNRIILEHRIKEYLTDRVRTVFREDFKIIEDILPEYLERYNLKELIIILRIEVDKRKRKAVP